MAGTSYEIDIQARTLGASEFVSALDAMERSLLGADSAAGAAAQALAGTNWQLEAAATAAAQAVGRVDEGAARYAELEAAADRTAKAVERAGLKGGVPPALQAQADAAAAALSREATALDKLQRNAAEAAQGQQQLAAAEAAAKATADAAARAEREHADAIAAAEKAAKQHVKSIKDVGEGLGALPGPLGAIGGLIGQGAGAVEKLGMGATAAAAGVAVFAAAVAAGTVAVIAGAAALTKYVLTQADAARNSALATEALMLQSPAFAGLDKSIRSVASHTNLSASELGDLAKSLDAAGVGADDMGAALLAAGRMKASGDGSFEKWIGDIKDGKSTVLEFTKAAEKNVGLLSRKLLSFEEQGKTLQRNIGEVFAGVNVDGFLGALDNVVRGFDDSTESGRQLKKAAKDAFQGIADAAALAVPVVEAFFIEGAIAALRLYLAVRPTMRAISSLLGTSDPTMEDALNAAAMAATGLAAVVGGVVTAAVGSLAIVAAPFLGMAQAASTAKDAIVAAVDGALAFVKGKSLFQVGTDLLNGLVNGIKGSAAAVLGALTGVIDDAVSAAKKLLGIASPSKVFLGIGENVGAGFERGIEGGTPGARSALEAMVSEPDTAPRPSVSTRSASLNMSGATFNFYGVEGADDAEGRFSELLTRALEGNLATLGAPA